MAGSVIQLLQWNLRMAYGRESSLEAAGGIAVTVSRQVSIHIPSWGAGCSGGSVVVISTLVRQNSIHLSSVHQWYQITAVLWCWD